MKPSLSLRQFSQTAEKSVMTAFPLKIRFPGNKPWLALPPTYRRLDTGEIEATYHDIEQLRWSVTLSLWAKEAESQRPAAPVQQTMFTETKNNYQE
ncbi:MAG: hypothetical protein KDJ52_00115 [Anaerolineae bacterium]|nr:hypothetical protein [Anaerolineae bacterium]